MALKYTTQENFNRFMRMLSKVRDRSNANFPDPENIGTGDNSTTEFTLDNGDIIQDTVILSHGANTSSRTTLEETTHYTINYDDGIITLTSAGVTEVGTDNIYAYYSYNKHGISNSIITQYLEEAESFIDQEIDTVFRTSSSDDNADYVKITDELKIGQGQFNPEYQTDNYPLNSTTTTLDGAVSADDETITVVSTDGFPSSGYIGIENNKITYTGKTDTTFTGCSNVSAHDDGKVVTSFIMERSLDPEGDSPDWEVLAYDSDYSVDFESGMFRINRDWYAGELYTYDSPPRGVYDRVRLSYQYGYSSLPAEIVRLVHLIAGNSLYTNEILNAVSRGKDGFNSQSVETIKEEINRILNRYKTLHIKAIKP